MNLLVLDNFDTNVEVGKILLVEDEKR